MKIFPAMLSTQTTSWDEPFVNNVLEVVDEIPQVLDTNVSCKPGFYSLSLVLIQLQALSILKLPELSDHRNMYMSEIVAPPADDHTLEVDDRTDNVNSPLDNASRPRVAFYSEVAHATSLAFQRWELLCSTIGKPQGFWSVHKRCIQYCFRRTAFIVYDTT